jgi:hypothetical protein
MPTDECKRVEALLKDANSAKMFVIRPGIKIGGVADTLRLEACYPALHRQNDECRNSNRAIAEVAAA